MAKIDIEAMDRRTFVLLTGAASGALIRPPVRLSAPPLGRRALGVGRLRFELDERRRWSLWYSGDARPVPLVRDAELGAWIGDAFVTLADLQDSTVGSRRPPGGEAIVVRGRAADVVLEAEFVSLGDADAPQAAVTLTLYPDRVLPAVRGVRFFRSTEPDLVPGGGALLALVNGADSWAATSVETVSARAAGSQSESYGAIGLTRGSHGLALAFDPAEPGQGKVEVSRTQLEAVSEWLPAEPLRPEGDASTLRLCYQPSGDGLEALDLLFAPISPVDRERLATAAVPTGWCSWYELSGGVTEADMIANLEFCAAHFDRRFFGYVQLDDGYQRATGDWQTNDKFPHGHRWPVVGARRPRAPRRAHGRRGRSEAPRRDPRRAGSGGVRGRVRCAAPARAWIPERHAHRWGRRRLLGRHSGPGAGRGPPQLLPPHRLGQRPRLPGSASAADRARGTGLGLHRSEERRVGKECRSRWSPY